MPFGDAMPTTDRLRLCFAAEAELSADDHVGISAFLVAAFPEHDDAFGTASWYGARPDHRLWLGDSDGAPVAHLNFERRVIGVGDREVLVAGVGEVATHPERQGKGLGRQLTAGLLRILKAETPVDFGYVGCRKRSSGSTSESGGIGSIGRCGRSTRGAADGRSPKGRR